MQEHQVVAIRHHRDGMYEKAVFAAGWASSGVRWRPRRERGLFRGKTPPDTYWEERLSSETTALDLQRGPYRTTFVGIDVQRESTPQDWEAFGEVLRRVDEAKQWAIGDWLVDGKKHYGDRLYERAANLTGMDEGALRNLKSASETLPLSHRYDKLTHTHHLQVASLKTIAEAKDGKLYLSDETDYEKSLSMKTIETGLTDPLSMQQLELAQ